MNAKQAVKKAKEHIVDLFGDEDIDAVGLEEIEEEGIYWKITIGFSRGWQLGFGSIAGGEGRSYKVLLIDNESGNVISVRDRKLSKVVY